MGDGEKIAFFTIVYFHPVIKVFSHGKKKKKLITQSNTFFQSGKEIFSDLCLSSFLSTYVEKTISTTGVRALKQIWKFTIKVLARYLGKKETKISCRRKKLNELFNK